MRIGVFSMICLGALAGCATPMRRPAPPTVINAATPPGFPPAVRLVTTDLHGFADWSSPIFAGIRKAAGDGPVDVLALSGGGSEGAFGAGALVGLTEARDRPRFELVTGVSAGALIAPFAFLGPRWDPELESAFTTDHRRLLSHPAWWRVASRLVFPLGQRHRDALFDMVDHYVTPALVAAVARATERGRRLIIATTDLDSEETVLWDMGAIAEHGGESARALFRDVLVASASVPGVFPPVLIRVRDGRHTYEEMHVDGSVTTPVFALPLVAGLRPQELPAWRGGEVYLIVNSQIARIPSTTPVSTLSILTRSFSASMTYKTREAILGTVNLTRTLGMRLRLTDIPADFPVANIVDFSPKFMRGLFDYGERCAASGRLWLTPEQSIKRNQVLEREPSGPATPCPGAAPSR